MGLVFFITYLDQSMRCKAWSREELWTVSKGLLDVDGYYRVGI